MRFKEKFPCYASMRCPFGFAMLQRSRLRLAKKLTGEFMRVNKLDFLKENTLFRNSKSKELIRNTTTASTAVNRELQCNGKEIVLRGQIVVLSRRRTSGRTDSTF